MISVYPSGYDRTVNLEYKDGSGAVVIPVSASYTVLDEDNAEVVASTALSVSGPPTSVNITVTAANNTPAIGATRVFRTVRVTFTDAGGTTYEQTVMYIAENATIVEEGVNSFAAFGRLFMILQDMPELSAAIGAAERDLKTALINAWYNIGNLKMTFTKSSDATFNAGLEDIHTTLDITAVEILLLNAKTLNALKRAQMIEANALLGGNPIEDRRRMGLISDSAGESTHFFRTKKPLELPVHKATANALRGYVDWTMKSGRG